MIVQNPKTLNRRNTRQHRKHTTTTLSVAFGQRASHQQLVRGAKVNLGLLFQSSTPHPSNDSSFQICQNQPTPPCPASVLSVSHFESRRFAYALLDATDATALGELAGHTFVLVGQPRKSGEKGRSELRRRAEEKRNRTSLCEYDLFV